MATLQTCPNCIQIHDTISDNSTCLLHACVAIIVNERGDMTAEEGQALLQSTDVTAFWGALGPVITQLRDGAFKRQVDYVVRWEIDIVASSPEEAATQAMAIMQDRGSWARFFEVRETRDERKSADVVWTRVELPVASFATLDGEAV